MIVLQIMGIWCAAIVICAPVLVPVLVRRFRRNYFNHRARVPALRVVGRKGASA